MSSERNDLSEKTLHSVPERTEKLHDLSLTTLDSAEMRQFLRSEHKDNSSSSTVLSRNDRLSKWWESSRDEMVAALARLREDSEFATAGSAAEQRFIKTIQDNPESARPKDVDLVMKIAERCIQDQHHNHEAHLSEAGRTLLQLAGRGLPSVRDAAARAFKDQAFPGVEESGLREALLKYAENGGVDPMYSNAIRRYTYNLDGEQAFTVPTRWDNALAQADKPARREVTDAPVEVARRDDTVKAIEKVMPSYADLTVKKTGGRVGDGSAIAIDSRGYFLTAKHVIDDSEGITVKMQDGTSKTGRVVMQIPHLDLAVVKVDKRVPEVKLGPAKRSDLLLGEKVIAIGKPFGFETTVSTGILSSKSRTIEYSDGTKMQNMIQATLAINPGNSGGPLINRSGELIGIVTAIRDGAQNMAFVVNADNAQRDLAWHMSAEKIAKIKHGISSYEEVTKQDGPGRQSVKLSKITAGTPAAEAGLKEGDVIAAINGKGVMNRFDVERAFWDQKANSKVKVSIVRNGKEMDLELVCKAVPKPPLRK